MSNKKKFILGGLALSTLIIFIIWAVLVSNGVTQALDDAIVEAVVNFRGEKGGFWYWLTRITTEFGDKLIIIGSILVCLIVFRVDLKSLSMGLGAGSVHLINSAVKKIVNRERPLEIYHWMSESSKSFPSGHTINSTFLYGFIAYLILTSNLKNKIKYPLAGAFIFVIPWVGFTRIVLSVHYFSDVIGGMLFGSFILISIILIYETLKSKGIDGFRPLIDKKLKKSN